MIEFTIWGQPTSKKNSSQLTGKSGRGRIIPSKEYLRWLREADRQMRIAMAGCVGLPIKEPVALKVLAYRHTHRKIDLPNIIAAVADMLETFGVLEDDEQVFSLDGSRRVYGVAKELARVEITIEEGP